MTLLGTKISLSVWALLKMMFLFPFGGICCYASSLTGNWFVFRGSIILPPFMTKPTQWTNTITMVSKAGKNRNGILQCGKVRSLVVVKGIALEPPKRSPFETERMSFENERMSSF